LAVRGGSGLRTLNRAIVLVVVRVPRRDGRTKLEFLSYPLSRPELYYLSAIAIHKGRRQGFAFRVLRHWCNGFDATPACCGQGEPARGRKTRAPRSSRSFSAAQARPAAADWARRRHRPTSTVAPCRTNHPLTNTSWPSTSTATQKPRSSTGGTMGRWTRRSSRDPSCSLEPSVAGGRSQVRVARLIRTASWL
jgi:hypothetical protein